MPNRILRDWTDSAKFHGTAAEVERLFVRLLMKADDFGRFHAHPQLVKSACFPLAEDLRADTVAAWLTELSDRHLVFCYTSGIRNFLAIINFRQRLKQSIPKFPPPPGRPDNWMPDERNIQELPGTSGNVPLETETETETEAESNTMCGELLRYLNEKAGRSYRETDTNLKLVGARLKESGVTPDGIKAMIDRMVARWGKDAKMAEYLRPETLFGKTKFGGYYDNRNLPIDGKRPPRSDASF